MSGEGGEGLLGQAVFDLCWWPRGRERFLVYKKTGKSSAKSQKRPDLQEKAGKVPFRVFGRRQGVF